MECMSDEIRGTLLTPDIQARLDFIETLKSPCPIDQVSKIRPNIIQAIKPLKSIKRCGFKIIMPRQVSII
jgi:hypothetical protein